MKNGIIICNVAVAIMFAAGTLNATDFLHVVFGTVMVAVSWRSAYVIARQAEQLADIEANKPCRVCMGTGGTPFFRCPECDGTRKRGRG